jgi:hypothetical protein
MSEVILVLTPPGSRGLNSITESFNQTINTTALAITISALDFYCLCAEGVNMGPYLMNRP